MRSETRRLGARFRPRFKMRTWCRIKTDSATTDRSPPCRASRIMMTIRCRKRMRMWRMPGMVSNLKTQEFRALAEFATDTCEVEHVSDGNRALTRARLFNPDLILLDLILPGLDGLEVCRRVNQGAERTPVIILTARHL